MSTNNTNIDTLHLNGATYTILCINLSSSSTSLRSKGVRFVHNLKILGLYSDQELDNYFWIFFNSEIHMSLTYVND